MPSDAEAGRWNYRPEVPIPLNPLFNWPPRPVAVLRWYRGAWLQITSLTVCFSLVQPASTIIETSRVVVSTRIKFSSPYYSNFPCFDFPAVFFCELLQTTFRIDCDWIATFAHEP